MSADLDGQGLGPQPRTLTAGARLIATPSTQENAYVQLVRPALEPLKKGFEATETSAGHPLDQPLHLKVGQMLERNVYRDVELEGGVHQTLKKALVGRR
jgi:hypothetical protein